MSSAEPSCAGKRVEEMEDFERIASALVEVGASHRRLQIGRFRVGTVCHRRNSTASKAARQDGRERGKRTERRLTTFVRLGASSEESGCAS
jgi:hypothetical protein